MFSPNPFQSSFDAWTRALAQSGARSAATLTAGEMARLIALGERVSAGRFTDDRGNELAVRVARWKRFMILHPEVYDEF